MVTSNFPDKGRDETVRRSQGVLSLEEMRAVVLSGEMQPGGVGAELRGNRCHFPREMQRPVRTAARGRFLILSFSPWLVIVLPKLGNGVFD